MAKRSLRTQSYDQHVLSMIRRIIQAFDVHSRSLYSRYGLTGPQLVCLLEVIENEATTAREISQRIHLGPSTLVGVLNRLEAKGYIERHRDSGDRRKVRISATREGHKIAEVAPSPMDERLVSALSHLSEKKQARIAKALRQLVEMIELSPEGEEPPAEAVVVPGRDG